MDDSPAVAQLQPPYLTTPAIRQRLDLLGHLLEFGHQMVVIQGEAGSGRSRMLRAVADQTRTTWRVIQCDGATIHTAPALLEALATALELGELDAGVEDLRARLAEIELGGQLCILALDDAENLNDSARAMLFSLAYSEHQRGDLRVVIAGDAYTDFGEQLQAVAPEGAVIHVVDVPPLDIEELKTLALSVLPAAAEDSPLDEGLDLDQLAAAAEGNPGRMLASLQRGRPVPILLGKRAASAARAVGGAVRGFNIRKYAAALAAAAFVLVAVAIGTLLVSRHSENTTPGTVEITLPAPSAQSPALAEQTMPPAAAPTVESLAPPSAGHEALPAPPEPTAPVQEPDAVVAEAAAEIRADKAEAAPANPALPPPVPTLQSSEPTPSPASAATKKALQTATSPKPLPTKAPVEQTAAPKRQVKPVAKPAASTDETLYTAKWLKRQKPQHYVIQLFGSRDRAATTRFIRDHGLSEKATVLEVKLKGAPWFVVVTGLYTARTAANSAIRAMPAPLARQKPWPRAVSTLK